MNALHGKLKSLEQKKIIRQSKEKEPTSGCNVHHHQKYSLREKEESLVVANRMSYVFMDKRQP